MHLGRWAPSIPLLAALVAAETVVAPGPAHTDPPLQSASPLAAAELPVVLDGTRSQIVPRSVSDLRAIEDHIAELFPRVQPVTVGIQVGPAFGSGVVVSDRGLVMTAGHVSGTPGQKAKIIFSNGREFSGRTLGQNRNVDTGLIQIDGSYVDWPHAEIAPDDSAQTGDWVLTLGHPGGVVPGRAVVPRLGRIISAEKLFLQTDCELVGGDSGGPMFDMQGRVIAINSRIGADTDWNLHVPVAKFRSDWDRLLASESFIEPTGAMLGLRTRDSRRGVVVEKVFDDLPAARSRIKAGDILRTFQGELIEDEDHLKELVATQPLGTVATITLIRATDDGPEPRAVDVFFNFPDSRPNDG